MLLFYFILPLHACNQPSLSGYANVALLKYYLFTQKNRVTVCKMNLDKLELTATWYASRIN